jgi:anti-sigma B factor antagonist
MAELDDDLGGDVMIATEVDAAGEPIVVVSGEIDMSNAGSLSAAVAPITATQPSRLTFDLTGLRFIDSAGIAVLLAAAAKTTVSVRNPSPIVRSVIEATGLTAVLRMASDS